VSAAGAHGPGVLHYSPWLPTLWLLPLIGAVVLWTFGPQLRRNGGILASVLVLASFFCALGLFAGTSLADPYRMPLLTWIPGFTLGLALDPLSLLWTLIITGVGGLIHVYAIGYMWSDRAIARFFAYMNFFVFAMLTLVLSDNVLGLLVGWGLVGLASYFLIGFWFYKPSAVAAARKAFVINVVGDVGLMFALFVLFAKTGSITYGAIFARVPEIPPSLLFIACVALLVGAAAKSAQVPLHTWLPDAMEGPTPVSALIHAATMVTAGVYLVARFAPLWNASPSAQELTGVVGAVTLVLGAILGIGQWDIKRILAYSTMSQIGYMMLGVGVGAYQAGVLHFFTHAFFKAQLFLGAGIVIHALHDEQDIRKMGGLYARMPFAFWAMLLGTLAIIGFPLFSGSYSKDAVIYGALEHGHPWLYAAATLTAGITAYYMFRLLFVAFFGPDRSVAPAEAQSAHVDHAPSWIMQVPVAILMVPTVIAGYLSIGGASSPWYRFFGASFATNEIPVASAPPVGEWLSSLIVLAFVALGIIVAYARYGAPAVQLQAVERLQQETQAMPAALTHAFWFDDAISLLVVRPAQALGAAIVNVVDPHVIDAGGRDLAWLGGALGLLVRAVQNGLVRAYALTIVIGAAFFIAYFALSGAAH